MYQNKHIYELAAIIQNDWKKINYTAKPYLDAMHSLSLITDMYGCDEASSIIAYFLSNATGWRGDTAKAVKAELNRRIK